MSADTNLTRATAHGPKSYTEIKAAARQLAANNYSPHTIAAVLRIDVMAVQQMLGPSAVRP